MPKKSSIAPVLSAVILAGGTSRRLGQDKRQLKLEKQTLLARSITAMSSLTDDVIVVTSQSEPPSETKAARAVSDVIAGSGALSGLHAGLQATRHDYALVIACDMPFLNMRLLRYMAIITPGYDAVVPIWNGEAEPLHAIYARTCLPVIEALLNGGGGRIIEFFPHINVRYLELSEITLFDPEGLTFFNINTPEDWERAQALAATWDKEQNA